MMRWCCFFFCLEPVLVLMFVLFECGVVVQGGDWEWLGMGDGGWGWCEICFQTMCCKFCCSVFWRRKVRKRREERGAVSGLPGCVGIWYGEGDGSVKEGDEDDVQVHYVEEISR